MSPDYSIKILEYARIPHQVSEAAYSGYAYPGETMCFPFTFILVEGAGRRILIDCGIDFGSETKRRMAADFGLENMHSSSDVLAGVGLSPEDIDVVIPTHAHWDHMGALRLFTNAMVYIQRAERDGWQDLFHRSDAYAALLSAMDVDDIECLHDIEREGRLVLLDGEATDLLPGIHVWVDLQGHSHASQIVLIESGTGKDTDRYIAIGDVAYTLDNLTGVPSFPHFIPNTKWAIGGAYSTMQSYERILDYVGEDHHRILIEHDARNWERYPTTRRHDGLHIATVREALAAASPGGHADALSR